MVYLLEEVIGIDLDGFQIQMVGGLVGVILECFVSSIVLGVFSKIRTSDNQSHENNDNKDHQNYIQDADLRLFVAFRCR